MPPSPGFVAPAEKMWNGRFFTHEEVDEMRAFEAAEPCHRVHDYPVPANRVCHEPAETLHFTTLREFEFVQAIELQVWLHSGGKTKGYNRHEDARMLRDWESDIATGINRRVPFDMGAVIG